MSALWTFGSVGIFVSDEEPKREVFRAKLKILDQTTESLQYFGAGSQRYTLKGLVIGDADLTSLTSWAINNTSQTFTGPWGSFGTYKIDGEVGAEAVQYASATIDGTTYSASTTPIYRVTLDLISTT